MSGGFTAATDAMASASKAINQVAQDLLDDNPDLSSTPVTAAGFGQAHGAHAEKYTTGAQTLWSAVSGYSTTLGTFGSTIGSSGDAYGGSDSTQTGSITNAGAE